MAGSIVGAIGTPISNALQGHPLFQDFFKNINETAATTGDFGKETGEQGVINAPAAGFGAIPGAVMAASGVIGGMDQLREAVKSGDNNKIIETAIPIVLSTLMAGHGALKGEPFVAGSKQSVGEGLSDIGNKVSETVNPGVSMISGPASLVGAGLKAVSEGAGNLFSKGESAIKNTKEVNAMTPEEQTAIHAGVPKAVVYGVRSLDPSTLDYTKTMNENAQNGKDTFDAIQQANAQPKVTLGSAVNNELVSHLIEARDTTGKAVSDSVAAQPQTPKDFTAVRQGLIDSLRAKKVSIDKDGKLSRDLHSPVDEGDLPMYKAMLDELKPDRNGQVLMTPRSI